MIADRRFLAGSACVVVTVCVWVMLQGCTGDGGGTEPIVSHQGITSYDGPQTCVACHETEARQMFGAVHYQWSGPTPFVTNIEGDAGKNTGINTYCGAIVTSRSVTCRSCHVSFGKTPTEVESADQLNNIDCMMCHQDDYARKPGGVKESVTFTDYLGADHTWSLPVETADGSFSFEVDAAKMTKTPVEAARTVTLPTRKTCLRCHAYAGGGDGTKRGDLSSENAAPSRDLDVHMSADGENLTCQACHATSEHRILGRGLDLRESDRSSKMTCLSGGCHTSTVHSMTARLNTHTSHVACQTCHIPALATLHDTEMVRKWDSPEWLATMFSGQGGYKPGEDRQSNVTPTYAWYDGTSKVYDLGQVAWQNDAGQYEFAEPNGDVSGSEAMITPMKEHLSMSALHDATGQIIPHSTFTYFVTGDFVQAVEDGQAASGLTGAWTRVDVHTWQTINHGVQPKGKALACGQCHASMKTASQTLRMDLQGKLGYALKGAQATVCTQCHELEDDEEESTFSVIHDKHVDDKRYDCSWCHSFSRAERGLRAP